jgi:hypothetical protein
MKNQRAAKHYGWMEKSIAWRPSRLHRYLISKHPVSPGAARGQAPLGSRADDMRFLAGHKGKS